MMLSSCTGSRNPDATRISISVEGLAHDTIHFFQSDPLSGSRINTREMVMDGSGSGSLDLKYPDPSFVNLEIGDFILPLFCTRDSELKIEGKAEGLPNTLTVSGSGALPVNYLLAKRKVIERYDQMDGKMFFQLDSAEFWQRIDALNEEIDSLNFWLAGERIDQAIKSLLVMDSRQTSNLYKVNYALIKGYSDPAYFIDILYDEDLLRSFSNLYGIVLQWNYELQISRPLRMKSGAADNDSLAYLFPSILVATIDTMGIPGFAKDFYTARMLGSYYWGHQSNPVIEEVYDDWVSKYPESMNRSYVLNAKEQLTSLSPGSQAPAITGTDRSGHTFSSEQWKGHVLYVDVWATWCSPCREKIPGMYALQEAFKDRPEVKFLFVSIDNDHEKWQDYISKLPEGILHIQSNNPGFRQEYMIPGVPHCILIDASGKIITSNAPNPDSDEIKGMLEEAIRLAG